jgi:hypothetical protein
MNPFTHLGIQASLQTRQKDYLHWQQGRAGRLFRQCPRRSAGCARRRPGDQHLVPISPERIQASLQTRQKDYLHWQHDEGGKGQCGVLEK